jgi:hypothetical protein
MKMKVGGGRRKVFLGGWTTGMFGHLMADFVGKGDSWGASMLFIFHDVDLFLQKQAA